MKKTLSIIGQSLLFVVANAAGLFFHPFHLQSALGSDAQSSRAFVWDGFVLMMLVYIFLLLLELLLKAFRSSALWSTLAFILAAAATYRLGFVTHNW